MDDLKAIFGVAIKPFKKPLFLDQGVKIIG